MTLRRISTLITVAVAGAILAGPGAGDAAAKPAVVIKMGTAAPDGSSWHQILRAMGETWRNESAGAVVLRIYPGGVLGDEPDMVRKMRIGQIQAAALTAVGLADIDDAVAALQIPMMFQSYDELDHVREAIRPELERRFAEKGFVILNWGDAGWVKFFAGEPFARPDDLKKMKLFVWAGDSQSVDLWKAAGFRPVPLASTDILPGLQTGLIDAFDTTPLLALASQWFALAPNMLDLKWAPLVGATVVTRKTWEKIPPEHREAVRRAADEAGGRLRDEIRAANDKAVLAMKKRGLKIQPATPDIEAAWLEAAEGVYPEIRGTIVPTDMFDKVRRLRDAYRLTKSSPPE